MPRAEGRDKSFFFPHSQPVAHRTQGKGWRQTALLHHDEADKRRRADMGEAAWLHVSKFTKQCSPADKSPVCLEPGAHRFRSHYFAVSLGQGKGEPGANSHPDFTLAARPRTD